MHAVLLPLLRCACLGLATLQFAYGQLTPPPGGGETAAVAQAMTAVSGSLWGQSLNPASLASGDSAHNRLRAGVSFQQPMLVKELSTVHLVAAAPVAGKQHVIGFEAGSYGFEAFRQSSISVGYAGWFLHKLSVGTRLSAHNLTLRDLGSAWAITLDAGMQLRFNQRVTVGAAVQNATRTGYKTTVGNRERLATTLRLGGAYHPSDKLTVSADWVQTAGNKPGGAVGVAYRPSKAVAFRTGMGTQPQRWGLGISLFPASALRMDFAFVYAAQTGGTPVLSGQVW